MHLFPRNHADFDECCFYAQKFDDNCNLLHHTPNQDLKESGESSKNMEMHALVDLILQKLRQELNFIQPSKAYDPRVYPTKIEKSGATFVSSGPTMNGESAQIERDTFEKELFNLFTFNQGMFKV